MRKLIVLAFVLSAAACGSKKSPKSPANTQTEGAPATEGSGSGSDSDTAPAPGGAAGGGGMQSSDPCEGGQ